MRGKIVWLIVSCMMVAVLLVASCGPAEKEEVVPTPAAEEEKAPVEEKEEVKRPIRGECFNQLSGQVL